MNEADGAAYDPDRDADVVADARRRIADLRQREVTLRLVGRDGRPLSGVTVAVEQTGDGFPWGDQLWALDEMYRFGEGEMDRARAWKARFAEVFNAANALCYWTERPRNDGPKTEDRQGEPRYEGFSACVDWARAAGLMVKGHPLHWSIPKCVPEWVQRYPYETRLVFLEARVRSLVARFRGRVALWDAVNEALWEPAFRNLPDRRWPHVEDIGALAEDVARVLRWARDEDPDAAFVLNDYGMEANPEKGAPVAADGTAVTAALQRRRMCDLLGRLADLPGAPLPDAVGLQSHTGAWLTPGAQRAVYDELAEAGLPLHVTEFWAETGHLKARGLPPDEIDALQAAYVENYLTVAFGHPAVEAFFFWGFMGDAIRWGERSSHEPKPLFGRVRALLRNTWRTRATLCTDADGVARFRGFYGRYALGVAAEGAATARRVGFAVDRHAAMPLTLTLPPPRL